jgi:hypothetical protein
MPTVVGADRSYVKQGKDPETALRLSEPPTLDWIRLVIDSYGSIASDGRRQISVSSDRLLVHAKAEEVAEHLLPTVARPQLSRAKGARRSAARSTRSTPRSREGAPES